MMKKLTIDGDNFYTMYNIVNDDIKTKLIDDIEHEAKERPFIRDTAPPIQTYSDLLEKYQTLHWVTYKKKILDFIMKCVNKKVNVVKTWAFVSIPNTHYNVHSHPTDLTAILYLQNRYASYGTLIKEQFIMPGVEKSILLFDGKINHGIVNMPYEIAIKNRRISLVCDFNYA